MFNLTWARVQHLCTYCSGDIINVLNADYQIFTCSLSSCQVNCIPYIAVSGYGSWNTPYIIYCVLALLFLYYINFSINSQICVQLYSIANHCSNCCIFNALRGDAWIETIYGSCQLR